MVRWKSPIFRISIAVGAFVAFAVASGAGTRWV
jgi:uncharacterized membrane protein